MSTPALYTNKKHFLFGIVAVCLPICVLAQTPPQTQLSVVNVISGFGFGETAIEDFALCRRGGETFVVMNHDLDTYVRYEYISNATPQTPILFGNFAGRRFTPVDDCSTIYVRSSRTDINLFDTESGALLDSLIIASEEFSASGFLGDLHFDPINGYLYLFDRLARLGDNPGLLEIDPVQKMVLRAIMWPENGPFPSLSFAIHPGQSGSLDLYILDDSKTIVRRYCLESGSLLEEMQIPPLIVLGMPLANQTRLAIDPQSGNIMISTTEYPGHFNFFELVRPSSADGVWQLYE